MPRSPEPQIGQKVDESLVEHLASAVALNPAVHDGAIMMGREDESSPYRICGWSYRLFPSERGANRISNRGSAFNSCLAMSVVPGVDRLYMVKREHTWRFEEGFATELDPPVTRRNRCEIGSEVSK